MFKLKRKIAMQFAKWRRAFFIAETRSLYRERFSAPGDLFFGKHFAVHFDASNSIVNIGKGVQFRDFCQLRSGTNGKLKIGERIFFNNGCSVTCLDNIIIGDDCQFGENVKLYDANHQYKNKGLISGQGYAAGPIVIGKNCWIGSNVIVLKNVEIGDNTVIGANCVIYKSIPPDSVVINDQNLVIKPLPG